MVSQDHVIKKHHIANYDSSEYFELDGAVVEVSGLLF